MVPASNHTRPRHCSWLHLSSQHFAAKKFAGGQHIQPIMSRHKAGPKLHHLHVVLLQLIAGFLSLSWCSAHRDGDYIHTARKSQYHQQRTNWHDVLGHHCPRFGADSLVAMPLPKPHGTLTEADEYKLQLSFDGERHLTHWLTITGKRAPEVPLVQVTLVRSGSELLRVRAQVSEAPEHYRQHHLLLVQEFKNASHWPKHLLVHYHFETQNDVDLDRGLYVLLALGLAASVLLGLNSMRGLQAKLAQFFTDMTGEDTIVPVTAWKGSKEG